MTDYFDFDDRLYNDDTCDRETERPRSTLKAALEYDKNLFKRILNYPSIEEADKYNLASMYEWAAYELSSTTETTKWFEDFLIEVNGREWFDSMMSAWLRRKSVEIAKNWGCPELSNTKGVYFYKDGEE